jgi:hypothetical protein
MTVDAASGVPAPAAMFDRIVAHESGLEPDAPGSLRPRLPYPFERLPLPMALEEAAPPPPVVNATDDRRVPTARETVARSNAHTTAEAPIPHPMRASSVETIPAVSRHRAAVADMLEERTPASTSEIGPAQSLPVPLRALDVPPTERTRGEPEISDKPGAQSPQAAVPMPQRPHTTLPDAIPQPLRPWSAPQSRADLRAAPRIEPATQPSEPTIEIHIGRIEVRAAAQAPAVAPRPRVTGAAPDRLDQYLGRRSRGARS